MRIRYNAFYVILSILLLGFCLRLVGIGTESYWVDEAISIRQVSHPFFVNIASVLGDVHPPLYNITLWFWTRIVGFSEVPTRFLSLIFSVASIYLLYLVAKKMFDEKVGIFSSLILAVSRIHVLYAQETRMYSLLLFLSLLSFYYYLNILENRFYDKGKPGVSRSDISKTDRSKTGISKKVSRRYIVSTIFLVYTHVFAWFVPLVQGSYLFLFRRKMFLSWLDDIKYVLLSYVLWLPILLYQFLKIKSSFWILKPDLSTLLLTLSDFSGHIYARHMFILISFLGLAFLISKKDCIKGKDKEMIYLLLIWLFLPVIILYLFSVYIKSFYIIRYILFCSFALYIFAAFVITKISKNKYLQYGLLLLLIVSSLMGVHSQYIGPDKQNWRGAVDILYEQDYDEEDVIIVHPFYEINAFAYYFDEHCFRQDSIYMVVDGNEIEMMDCEKGRKVYGLNALPENKTVFIQNDVWFMTNYLSVEDDEDKLFNWLNSSKDMVFYEDAQYLNVYKFE